MGVWRRILGLRRGKGVRYRKFLGRVSICAAPLSYAGWGGVRYRATWDVALYRRGVRYREFLGRVF